MNDLISRHDAIDAIREIQSNYVPYEIPEGVGADIACDKIIKMLNEFPSADRSTGEWVDIDNYYRMATCSHCHKVTMFEKWGEYTQSYNYCPNCGARMFRKDGE